MNRSPFLTGLVVIFSLHLTPSLGLYIGDRPKRSNLTTLCPTRYKEPQLLTSKTTW